MNTKVRVDLVECYLKGIEHSIALIRQELEIIKGGM